MRCVLTSSVLRARSRLGNAQKQQKHDPSPEGAQRVDQARRDLAAAKLEAYIRAVVAAAEPLNDDQVSRLRLLLRGTP